MAKRTKKNKAAVDTLQRSWSYDNPELGEYENLRDRYFCLAIDLGQNDNFVNHEVVSIKLILPNVLDFQTRMVGEDGPSPIQTKYVLSAREFVSTVEGTDMRNLGISPKTQEKQWCKKVT
jgi:hypothetical protein